MSSLSRGTSGFRLVQLNNYYYCANMDHRMHSVDAYKYEADAHKYEWQAPPRKAQLYEDLSRVGFPL